MVQGVLPCSERAATTAPLHLHALRPVSRTSFRNPRLLHANHVVCRRQPFAALAMKLEPVAAMPHFAGELHVHRLGPARCGGGGGARCFAHFRGRERFRHEFYNQWAKAYEASTDDRCE